MKTIEELLSVLPVNIRRKAFENTESYMLKQKSVMKSALMCAFVWSKSPEGFDYWAEIEKEYFS